MPDKPNTERPQRIERQWHCGIDTSGDSDFWWVMHKGYTDNTNDDLVFWFSSQINADNACRALNIHAAAMAPQDGLREALEYCILAMDGMADSANEDSEAFARYYTKARNRASDALAASPAASPAAQHEAMAPAGQSEPLISSMPWWSKEEEDENTPVLSPETILEGK